MFKEIHVDLLQNLELKSQQLIGGLQAWLKSYEFLHLLQKTWFDLSVPIWLVTITCNSSFRKYSALFRFLKVPGIHIAYIRTYSQTFIQKINLSKSCEGIHNFPFPYYKNEDFFIFGDLKVLWFGICSNKSCITELVLQSCEGMDDSWINHKFHGINWEEISKESDMFQESERKPDNLG